MVKEDEKLQGLGGEVMVNITPVIHTLISNISLAKDSTFDSVNSVSTSIGKLALPQRSLDASTTPHKHFPNHYGDERSLKAALWRTLRHDHPYLCDTKKTCLEIRWIDWSALSRDADGLSPDFWKSMTTITRNVFWQTFESFRQTNANFSILGLKLRDMFPEMDPWSQWWVAENSEETEHIELLNQMASDMHLVVLALTGRRLVTTSTGYLGLAPAELLEGRHHCGFIWMQLSCPC